MTTTKPTVIGIGEAMIEFSRRSSDCWQMGFAGDSLNVLWAMRGLLDESQADLEFFTRVGSDPQSDGFLDFLKQNAISTGWIERDQSRNMGLYTITTDPDGERSFSYWRSTSAARGLADDEGAMRNALASAQLFYLSGISLAILPDTACEKLITVLETHKADGTLLAFDPNIRPALWSNMDRCRRIVEHVAALSDIVLPTHDDEAAAFGDADAIATVARYAKLGVPEIVVKDGLRPTRFHGPTGAGKIDVANPQKAIDTTGAGDGFNGGYLAARLTGSDVAGSIAVAQDVSSQVVMTRGALVPMDVLRTRFTQSGSAIQPTHPEGKARK
jgi:2-dehydro-3-deoxygluconokinase